jgi:ABC-type glycerol-3-phosphate transport system substrate-binding protein
VSGYDEMSQHLGSEIAKVLQGQGTPQEALDRAAAASSDALSG